MAVLPTLTILGSTALAIHGSGRVASGVGRAIIALPYANGFHHHHYVYQQQQGEEHLVGCLGRWHACFLPAMGYSYHLAASSTLLVVLAFGAWRLGRRTLCLTPMSSCSLTRIHALLSPLPCSPSYMLPPAPPDPATVVYIARHRLPSGIRTRLGLGERGMLGSTPSGMGGAGRGLYSHIPAYDWTTSRLAGLHSTLFDIEANVRGGDTRVGLEGAGAAEIERLMQTQAVVRGRESCSFRLCRSRLRVARGTDDSSTLSPPAPPASLQDFDTARLMLNQARFSKNNIDPRTGMPLDSKAVTFENLR